MFSHGDERTYTRKQRAHLLTEAKTHLLTEVNLFTSREECIDSIYTLVYKLVYKFVYKLVYKLVYTQR